MALDGWGDHSTNFVFLCICSPKQAFLETHSIERQTLYLDRYQKQPPESVDFSPLHHSTVAGPLASHRRPASTERFFLFIAVHRPSFSRVFATQTVNCGWRGHQVPPACIKAPAAIPFPALAGRQRASRFPRDRFIETTDVGLQKPLKTRDILLSDISCIIVWFLLSLNRRRRSKQ